MVWGLFPVDSLPGDQKYFIFSKGTYKVGRKGCDVIVNTDKGVSRIHAEIIVDSMTSMDPVESRSSDVRIKDCSKYGTFINKKLGSKTKVHDYPNKVTTLKDGDLISFGTGNATYRFCFVPLIFFVYSTKPFQVDRSLQDQISSIGACDSQNWRADCTHALVDESSPVKEDLIDVVVDKKPVILKKWVKVLAEKSISTELPGFVDCVPVMTFEGSAVKVVDPKARENSLADYTFLLGATHLYKFGDRLQSLLDVGGAKVLSINDFCSNSQASEDVANSGVVLVNPTGSTNQFSAYQHLRSVPRVTEVNLISAVLSGHLDSSFVESPPILISSSCSTDETMVADSDVEMDTAASDCIAPEAQSDAIKHEEAQSEATRHEETQSEAIKHEEAQSEATRHEETQSEAIKLEEAQSEATRHEETQSEAIKHEEAKETIADDHAYYPAGTFQIPSFKVEDGGIILKKDKGDEIDTSSCQNSDIIYSQDLIIRATHAPVSFRSSASKGVVNFKRFRKREIESGNSFKDLIPFSKYPYRESEHGNEEVAEHVKEEKKRKQIEAIAEDLFNNEKTRKRGATGSSIRELLSRR